MNLIKHYISTSSQGTDPICSENCFLGGGKNAQMILLKLWEDLLASFDYYQRPQVPFESTSRYQPDTATMPA